MQSAKRKQYNKPETFPSICFLHRSYRGYFEHVPGRAGQRRAAAVPGDLPRLPVRHHGAVLEGRPGAEAQLQRALRGPRHGARPGLQERLRRGQGEGLRG